MDTDTSSKIQIDPVDLSDEPKLYRMVLGAVGGQGGGAISEILFNAVRIERLIYGGEKGKAGSFEKRSMTPGLAQRSGSTITSLSFIDTKLTEDQLPDNIIISEMPHRGSCDVIFAQEINELMKYIERAKPTAWVIANEVRTITPPEKMPDFIPKTDIDSQVAAAKKYLENGNYIGLDGAKIIKDNGLHERSLNVIMMGMLSASEIVPISRTSFLEALKLRFKGKLYDSNIQAFEVGEKYYLEGRYKERDEKFSWIELDVQEIKNRSLARAIQFRRKRAARKLNDIISPIYDELISKYPDKLVKYVIEGYGQLIDFQDKKHGDWYLKLVDEIYNIDKSTKNRMTIEFSRNIAGRIMQWEGPFRVAEYAINEDFETTEGQIYHIEKKLQPTLEEIIGMIPVPNFFYKRRPERLYRWYEKRKFKGRSTSIRPTGFFGYSFFWFLSKFKKIRRTTVRFRREKILIQKIHADILELNKLSPVVAEELAWYIGKIKGYSFVRHDHVQAYHKLVDGIHSVYSKSGESATVSFIKNTYSLISNAGQNLDQLDELIEDHIDGRYIIPLMLPE